MSTIKGTVNDSTVPPFVDVEINFTSPETVASWRVTRRGGFGAVLLRTGETPADALFTFEDAAAPFKTNFTYELVVTRDDGTVEETSSEPVGIFGVVGCWLSDLYTGQTTRVTIVEWEEEPWLARQGVFPVAGRHSPIVVSDKHVLPNSQITFGVRTEGERVTLHSILSTNRIVLLRIEPGEYITSGAFVVGDFAYRRYSRSGTDARRYVDVQWQQIDVFAPGSWPVINTLQGLNSYMTDNFTGKMRDFPDAAGTLAGLSRLQVGSV